MKIRNLSILAGVFLGGAGVGYFTDYSINYFQDANKLKNYADEFDLDKYNADTPYSILIEKMDGNEWVVERRFKIDSIDDKNLSVISVDDDGNKRRLSILVPETEKILVQFILRKNL